MPVTKYRTLASRDTLQAYDDMHDVLYHLPTFALELKAVSATGLPTMGWILELSDPIPTAQVPHLNIELIG